jgi:glucose/arabinose dehydrogenase
MALPALLVALVSNGLWAQTYPTGFSQMLVAGGLNAPTALAFAPDGRIFVCEKGGALRVIKNGSLLPTPFTTLTVNSLGERGLIGIALDPGFATNQYVYLYYTTPGPPLHNRISRFTANGDVALAGSGTLVLDLDPLSSASNHNGGAMHFAPDSTLFVAVGENANPANSQNLNTYHGKLLRINPDGSVPPGNPYTGMADSEQKKRVWAHGLRNPYTFCFQPGTGRLFVNDVGQSAWEEVNDATASGLNFGWPAAEGTSANPAFTNPVFSYPHSSSTVPSGCAITGGTFFNPSITAYPAEYVGRYFLLEYCSNWLNVLDLSTTPVGRSDFGLTLPSFSLNIETGPDGNLYFLSIGGSGLYRIIYTDPQAPVVTAQPTPLTVVQGEPASFSVGVAGSATLSLQWRHDGTDIPGATSPTLTLSSTTPPDAGQYDVRVSNPVATAFSNAALLTVTDPLPVTLTAFMAQPMGSSVQLRWTTAQEKNNARFYIERRRADGVFEEVGSIAGRGETGGRYQWLDLSAAGHGPRLYYRLRQADHDGRSTWSAVRSVVLSLKTEAALYPNPSTEAVTLDLSGLPATTYSIRLSDLRGRLLLSTTGRGGQVLDLPVSALPAGSYQLQLLGENQARTLRLVKP